jgi:hypothetical protein
VGWAFDSPRAHQQQDTFQKEQGKNFILPVLDHFACFLFRSDDSGSGGKTEIHPEWMWTDMFAFAFLFGLKGRRFSCNISPCFRVHQNFFLQAEVVEW